MRLDRHSEGIYNRSVANSCLPISVALAAVSVLAVECTCALSLPRRIGMPLLAFHVTCQRVVCAMSLYIECCDLGMNVTVSSDSASFHHDFVTAWPPVLIEDS